MSDSANMFYSTLNLIGGNGTIWNANYLEKEYARIDTVDMLGYFTFKQN